MPYLMSSTMWSCQPSSHPTKNWRLFLHPLESWEGPVTAVIDRTSRSVAGPSFCFLPLGNHLSCENYGFPENPHCENPGKALDIRCYGKRKREWKRTMGQRERKCQIRVLENSVCIFIVLLSQGFMSKDYCGWRSVIKTFRDLEIYFPQVIYLWDPLLLSPERILFVSLTVSVLQRGGRLGMPAVYISSDNS